MYAERTDRSWRERGQTTVALAVALALAAVAIVGLAVIGEAMWQRAISRTAADAIALARVQDDAAVSHLISWYEQQGVRVDIADDATMATHGRSQAAAWAGPAASTDLASPALQAVLARAEQLLARPLPSAQLVPNGLRLNEIDSATFRQIAAEFGLCEVARAQPPTATHTFKWC